MLLRPLLAAAALTLLGGACVATSAPADSVTANVATPGAFHGYGFDQCLAPSQKAMDVWLRQSPYLAVGIYISGASRACRVQPNLTPTWVTTQLRNGWKLLPITLGPQASCNARFPRYAHDVRISADPGKAGRYATARRQGAAEADKTVAAAKALGLSPGSTLWYDLEGFDATRHGCRYSAMAFLSAWTRELHTLHYVSGVYSSAGSGIWMLDQARMKTPTTYHLPDQIWIARWDGQANTSTTYISNAGWQPGGRMKQYVGGHNERYGGVTINIDRDYLSLGTPKAPAESHCGGVPVDFADYPRVTTASDPALVKALQCLLTEQKAYGGRLTGKLGSRTVASMNAWQKAHDLRALPYWNRRAWMTLLATGQQPVLKFGSTGRAVRDLQRTLNAATAGTDLPVTGVFAGLTDAALRAWQSKVSLRPSGVANPGTWTALAGALRS
jgi:Rv2525c-like, glycoside hydrolase-like domain/Putative peptidoglycan binding domain